MKECPACRRCFPDDIIHCPQDGDETLPSLAGDPILDARYQLERRLGQGGMGVVFQARHIFLKTQHAIKVILPDLVGNDPMLVTRFRQEALAAAAVRHPNIIAVTDFGVVRSTMPFLVMEFINGKSLQDIMAEEGAMPPTRAFELICPTAAGVAAAHRQNIVHRDLKPLNIMICDGVPVAEGLKILDFGLAKIKSGELLGSFVQAKTTGLMGSPFYMAPEQWSDDEPDARADIYSLGVILYQMLGGDVPFKGASIPSIMKKHLTESPPPLSSFGVNVPPQIEAVVRHALEKEVADRTPSVEAFLQELNDAVNATNAQRTAIDAPQVDPLKTIVSVSADSPRGSTTQSPSGFETNFDPLAGTISSAQLDEEFKQQVAITGAAFKQEQAAKERFARQELAREAEERKRRQAAEDEGQRKEREAREEKERLQREQLDRVARQAEELEEKLARLTTSIPQQTGTGFDSEVTHLAQPGVAGQSVGQNSFPIGPQGQTWHPAPASIPGAIAGKKKSPALAAGVIVLAVVLGGGSLGAYFLYKTKTGTVINGLGNSNNGNTNNGNKGPSQPTPQVFKPDLVAIPGGSFKMGRNIGPPQETPAHQVSVQSFMMDKNEVTNAEYADFIRETNRTPPVDWAGTKPTLNTESWPVVNVSLDDANAFAAWRSKRDGVSYRLPTEEEWEYAARNGESDDLYPWGNEWKDKTTVVDEATPADVGSHPASNNKLGVADLIGNVWEWTSSKVTAYPGNSTTVPTSTKDWITIRGGGYGSKTSDKDNPVSACMRTFVKPSTKNTLLGFRLVRSGQ
jgi:serine/threonine protein kinase/formylglycine-generating enzyme required for sulfatase activity